MVHVSYESHSNEAMYFSYEDQAAPMRDLILVAHLGPKSSGCLSARSPQARLINQRGLTVEVISEPSLSDTFPRVHIWFGAVSRLLGLLVPSYSR